MSRTNQMVGVECLEDRTVAAGDVSAYLSGGNLVVTEAVGYAGLNNSVSIIPMPNGTVRVLGHEAADGGMTRINGQAYADFTVTGGYEITLGHNPSASAKSMASSTQSAIADIDDISLYNLSIAGSVNITTGRGDDRVYIQNCTIARPNTVADVSIDTGNGADGISITNSTIDGRVALTTYFQPTEVDSSSVWLENLTVAGDIEVRQGSGIDYFNLIAADIAEDLFLNTGAGDDIANLEDVSIGDELLVEMGAGVDQFTADIVSANIIEIDGGSGPGKDRISYTDLFATSIKRLTNWELVNGQVPGMPGQVGGGNLGLAPR